MSMMRVVRMRVRVRQGLVSVPVGMRHLLQLPGPMLMLMMLVVLVLVGVLQGLVGVGVNVHIGAQQERSDGHDQ